MKGLAFLFSGQGSQYVGMGQELYDNFQIARETFQEANEALGWNLQKLCFTGDNEELTKTANAQPAIITTSVAAFRILREEIGLTPQYVAGHSLGEYSALVASGALQFADAVKIVHKRGVFMQEAVPLGVGAMMAIVKVDSSIVDTVCKEVFRENAIVVAANYNSKQQTVISGHINAVKEAGERLEQLGATTRLLNVSAPFHSPLMTLASDKLKEELAQYRFGLMNYPVVANVTALSYYDTRYLIDNLAEQITNPVRWGESINYLERQGVIRAIEVGPKTVLQKLLKNSKIKASSFETKDQLDKLKEEFLIEDYSRLIIKALAIVVSTKNRNENRDEYAKGVVEPYQKIQALQMELEHKGVKPQKEDVLIVLTMLKEILTTKKVPHCEQVERFNELFEISGTKGVFKEFSI
ncbi:MAG: ACP S-malonyltransferase [Halanaerobiales bacterium]|nr:ACP S-malonyltransferase [Halanaerobiales bacterium]